MPPDSAINGKGNVVGFGENYHQRWLWDCWQDMERGVLARMKGRRFALIVNGDCTEGIHHRSPEVVSTRIEAHVQMAVVALSRLANAATKRYVVKGTECHVLDMENLVAERIQAESGKARDKWLVGINGCLIDAAHHIGPTSRAYLEASGMGINMGNARLNYARCGHEIPKVYLRGHRHCGGWFSDGSGIMGITGGWQFLTRHGHKVVTDSLPTPTALLFDWQNKQNGELPDVVQYRYPGPQAEISIA